MGLVHNILLNVEKRKDMESLLWKSCFSSWYFINTLTHSAKDYTMNIKCIPMTFPVVLLTGEDGKIQTTLPVLVFFFSISSIFIFYCVFFLLPFRPLIPPPPSNHHTVVHETFLLFTQFLHSLTSPSHCCHPALHLWVCLLFFLFSFSLDSTYEWEHMVFVFLWLAYFT